jgi:hypothetical protein
LHPSEARNWTQLSSADWQQNFPYLIYGV